MTNVDKPKTSTEARNALVLIVVSALQELHSGKPVPLSALAAQLRSTHPWIPSSICEPAVNAAYTKHLVVTDTRNGIMTIDLVEPERRREVFGGAEPRRASELGRAQHAADALDDARIERPIARDQALRTIIEARRVEAEPAADLLARAVNYAWLLELPDGFMSVRGLFHGTIDSGRKPNTASWVRWYQQNVDGSASIESQMFGADFESEWAVSLTRESLLQLRDAMDDGEYLLPALQRMFYQTGRDPKSFLEDQGIDFDFWSRMGD